MRTFSGTGTEKEPFLITSEEFGIIYDIIIKHDTKFNQAKPEERGAIRAAGRLELLTVAPDLFDNCYLKIIK